MKRLFAILWMVVSFANAQETITPNLIASPLSPVVNANSPMGYSGGSSVGYNSETNTYYFGYTQRTIATSIAINNALQGSGIQVNGVAYGMSYLNGGDTYGTLSMNVSLTSNTGATLQSYNHSFNTQNVNWQSFNQTQTFANPYSLTSLGNVSMSLTGKDSRFWAGYYGPQIRDPYLKLTYGADVCASDPLSSPTCPGYAAAYLTQQCIANPLYNASCPGYAVAYFTQQCSINSLYDPSCPGYAGAYLNYQCSINPLYSTTCSGYEQAYFNQQCNADPLYNKQCPGYAQAYALKYVVVTTPTTTQKPTTTSTTDSSGTVAIAVIADPVVNQTVTSTATSASPAQSATATVPLVQTPTATSAPAQSTSASPAPVASVETPKEQPKTARQELQAKREAAAKSAAIEKGKNLANDMGKATDIESQKQIQNVVIAAMGFTPGFDSYGKVTVPDAVGYKPFTVYNNQKTVDNRKVGLGLYGPSDRLHNELVESQYK